MNQAVNKRLIGLDSLRGIAALALVIFHVKGIPVLETPQAVTNIINHLGVGVPLFYAISAFSLILGYETKLFESDGISHFYIRRFFRIIPLFYVMLCVSLLIRAFYFHAPTSFSEMVLNASCLFGLLPPSHEGLVWASWSIGVEWIFYIFFPILMLMASTLMGVTCLFFASAAVSVASITSLEPLNALSPSFSYMAFCTQLVFFSGGLLAFKLGKKLLVRFPSCQNKKWLPTVFIIIALVYLVLLYNSPLELWFANRHLAVQSVVAAWIFLLMAALPGIKSLLDCSFLQRAGKLSFSLYLLNPPIIFGLFKSGFYHYVYAFCGSASIGFIICLIFSLQCIWIVAELSFFLVEQPGIYFGEIARLYCSNNPREQLKIREQLGSHKVMKKSNLAIILLVFLLMPWIIWQAGEIRMHRLKEASQKPSVSLNTTLISYKKLNLSDISPYYKTARLAAPGPWIESVSINGKVIAPNIKQTVLKVHEGDDIALSGWSADIEHPLHDAVTYIVLESNDKTKGWMLSTHSVFRKDVADFYHKKDLEQSGFILEGNIPKQLEKNQWSIILLTQGKDGVIKAPTKYTLEVFSSH